MSPTINKSFILQLFECSNFFIMWLHTMSLLFQYAERDRISFDYGQKIKFLAFCKQEKLGPYSPEKDLDTGYLDVLGADRRYSACLCYCCYTHVVKC